MDTLYDPAIHTSLQTLLSLQVAAQRLSLPSARRTRQQQQGRHRSKLRGRGLEFSEVRPYQPGDDIRTIDWRVTARRQSAHTKLFHEERERPLFLLCDQGQSQFFASRGRYKSVLAAEITALIAWLAFQEGDRMGGLVFSGDRIDVQRPDHRRRSLMLWLEHLANYNAALSADERTSKGELHSLNNALAESYRLVRPGSLVIVLSDFLSMDEETGRLLYLLRRHSNILAIRILDPLERALPDAGELAIAEGKTTLMLDTHQMALRKAYETHCRERDDALKTLLTQRDIPLIDGSTDDTVDQIARRVLQTVGRR